ncbi:MAG TPA: ABC transporter ATP-binding protein [Burkholderiales bacterium]|nr:ABC transporter ATP-binding protein [Burkholderiales bacterium]
MNEAVLVTEGLTRYFGGLAAVDGVSIACERGRVHAIIGPNGAGKSTLVNMLSGDLVPSSGRVTLRGADITGVAAHRISRLGIGRSYQKTNIFLPFTAFENCRLAAQSRLASSMRFFRPARAYRTLAEAAERALAAAGLDARGDMPAAALSHGEQRQLEIAMTLATEPEVLLLDEPLAGMGADESARMVELLRGLRASHAILLVEHDMDAVFSLADRLTVMVNGAVLAGGSAEEIRANPAVQEAYLGEA